MDRTSVKYYLASLTDHEREQLLTEVTAPTSNHDEAGRALYKKTHPNHGDKK